MELLCFGGMAITEVAAATGEPHGRLQHRYYRAIEKLRAWMRKGREGAVQISEGRAELQEIGEDITRITFFMSFLSPAPIYRRTLTASEPIGGMQLILIDNFWIGVVHFRLLGLGVLLIGVALCRDDYRSKRRNHRRAYLTVGERVI